MCYEINRGNVERELRGLDEVREKLNVEKCIIVSSYVPDVDTGEYAVIPLWRFLLGK